MFDRFTDHGRRVVVYAHDEAKMLGHSHIGTEHLLLGLIHEGEGVPARTLESMNISLEAARQQVEDLVAPGEGTRADPLPFTSRAKKVLELSLREAIRLGHEAVGPEHILLGLIREGEGHGVKALIRLGADPDAVRQAVLEQIAPEARGTDEP